MLPVRTHRDPAPSRLRYRLHRLWLTPLVRRMVWRGLPVLVAVVLGLSASSDPRVQQAYADATTYLRATIVDRPELKVLRMEVSGVSPALSEAIRVTVAQEFPVSSLDLDVGALRERVEALAPIAAARVRVDDHGVLRVEAEERVPVLIWRQGETLVVLDETGRTIAPIHARAAQPDLPVIAGAGADVAIAEALQILAAAAPLAPRIRGLVRVGERRWDLVLDKAQRIMLPSDAPVRALIRVIALNSAEELLSRDLRVVDMRDARRPILRISPYAVQEINRLRHPVPGEKT